MCRTPASNAADINGTFLYFRPPELHNNLGEDDPKDVENLSGTVKRHCNIAGMMGDRGKIISEIVVRIQIQF